ncbi:ribbon-helix-helix protein, CopG family [Phycicoccus sp. Soil802]|uniref:ribbon-helix-helix protein, CopG family n=1 Tax=Phycicoccus sp. Soil802 TaxID=1736414 RepID=UPI000B0B6BA6|nr:ribbon-helix-helix protein, CopG family [Phycicoccus sp. Soil802]
MAMTLRLSEDETEALRRRAKEEGRSMQEVARDAVSSYLEQASRRQIVDAVLDRELVRFADAIERLGQ